MTSEHYVEERNLTLAWAQGLRLASAPGFSEVAPLVLAITGFDESNNFEEEPHIRASLDRVLSENGKQSVSAYSIGTSAYCRRSEKPPAKTVAAPTSRE